jgi:hypothetical protein
MKAGHHGTIPSSHIRIHAYRFTPHRSAHAIIALPIIALNPMEEFDKDQFDGKILIGKD